MLAGLIATVGLTMATDSVHHAIGVYPPPRESMADPLFALALAYRVPFGALGGYAAARLAPDRPIAHAVALGAIGVVLSAAGAVAMWAFGPPWYNLTLIAIALPSA